MAVMVITLSCTLAFFYRGLTRSPLDSSQNLWPPSSLAEKVCKHDNCKNIDLEGNYFLCLL